MSKRDQLRGPEAIRYYPDLTWKLTWEEIPAKNVPYMYSYYWQALYNGKHVADVFRGKCGDYFAVIFGKVTIRSRSVKDAAFHVSGLVAGVKQ